MKKFIYLLIILPIILLPTIVHGADNIINGPFYSSDTLFPSYVLFMDNNGSSISRHATYLATNGYYDYADITQGSYGSGIAFNTQNALRGESMYAVTIYIGMEGGGTSLSSTWADASPYYDRVVVASSFDGLIDRYGRNAYNAVYATHKAFLNPLLIKVSNNIGTAYTGCLQYIFKVGQDGGNFIFIPYTTNNNKNTNIRNVFYGYSIEFLGSVNNLSEQDVRNAINSSGLATASSVNEVKQSTNQIKQEISGMQQEQQQTNEKLDDLNDNITSEEEPDIDLELDESSNTPISDLILFPITLLNKLINTIGEDTCSPYTLPFFYDTTITFPCFQLSNYLGTSITNSIDLFICLFMCYNLAMLFISIFEDITSLRDTYDSLYEPKHADTGYKPKHGKE